MSGVHGFRTIGRVKPPTPDEVAAYAESLHLPLTPAELSEMVAVVAGSLARFDHLDELPEPAVPLRHTNRDPGWVPTAQEDPYNAIVRFCRVEGAHEGPLAGKRLGVKDCIAVAGVPMTVGGRRQPYPVPTEDAVVVERLLDAGAIVTAKTNMEDMALGLGEGSGFGAARNPHGSDYSTGGSSSGSGAAVAGGVVDIALGADEGGSVRIPAAWCGLVGMKATHGLVPSHGLTYMDHTIDHIGPMTKTVRENAVMLEVMAGHDWRDPQWVRGLPEGPFVYVASESAGIEGMRIGVITEALEPSGCTPAVMDTFEAAQKRLIDLGAELVPVSLPLWTEAMTILMGALGFAHLGMYDSLGQGYGHLGRVDVNLLATTAAQMRGGARDLPYMLKSMLITNLHLRNAYCGVHFGKAQNLRLEMRRQVDEMFATVDLLITPTTPAGAFRLAEKAQTDGEFAAHAATSGATNTCPLDLTGHPALTVPAGRDEHGVPLGLQIIGPRFGEAAVYRAGFAHEAAFGPLPVG